MKNLRFILIILLGFACTDDVLELPSGKSLVVVEGWITDQHEGHWIKLSRTTGFYNTDPEVIIDDALVEIIEEGNPIPYPVIFDPAIGRYVSETFAGTYHHKYRVEITLENGEIIRSAWETLVPISLIEAIEFESFEDTDPETGEDITVYYPVVISLDPIDEKNNYRYKGYRNGQLLNEPEALILLSDEFNNGQTLRHHIPTFRLAVADEIRIELHSLNMPALRFLSLLKSQTTSLGSSSGTAPAKLVGNLINLNSTDIVLGYFGASSVHIATAVAPE